MHNNKEHIINQNETIKTALERINSFRLQQPLVLFVADSQDKITGSLTDGDIRRGLVNGVTLDCPVTNVMHKDFKYVKDLSDYKKINSYKVMDLKLVPLVTKDFKLVEFIDLRKLKAVIPVDAVIMAGGKGVRLKPYTNDTPKPMLELNGKPIIAHNIDRLLSYGITNIYISVNHLKEKIINYIKQKNLKTMMFLL